MEGPFFFSFAPLGAFSAADSGSNGQKNTIFAKLCFGRVQCALRVSLPVSKCGPHGAALHLMVRTAVPGVCIFRPGRQLSATMMYQPRYPDRLRATVSLPLSKSLSNRALLIAALSGSEPAAALSSVCDDTRAMYQALTCCPETVDVGAAGTAMRFLTAYWAVTPGRHVLTGSPRMLQRPIGILVDALRSLGAVIRYEGREGYPPLNIEGRRLQGGQVELPAHVSSQFVSALLMVAPCMERGLCLRLTGQVVSRPYIDMTLSVMRHFGARARWTDAQTLQVEAGGYASNVHYTPEADWSAASYWFEAVALSADAGAQIVLPGLQPHSVQGDSAVARYFAPLGVGCRFDATLQALVVEHNDSRLLPPGVCYELDLSSQPDLVQTLVVTCAMQCRPFRFSGVESLRLKETDRIAALRCELEKFGIALQVTGNSELGVSTYGAGAPSYDGRPIVTYNDHRMAMAFAPVAQLFGQLLIAHPEVVGKSYPNYWNEIELL